MTDEKMASPMVAGRELDFAIAERVFDWRWVRWEGQDIRWLTPPQKKWEEGLCVDAADCCRDFPADRYVFDPPPRFSTDVGAAMRVVTEVQRKNPGWRFTLLGGDSSSGYIGNVPQNGVDRSQLFAYGWEARFFGHRDPELNWGQEHSHEHADTAPLAICLAAINALSQTPSDNLAVESPKENREATT
jgi:hypothetical protein